MTPQDTQGYPGHPKIPQDAFNFLYNSFIYSFINFIQTKTKQIWHLILFLFMFHSFEKVLLNTAEKPYRHHKNLLTYNLMKCYIIFFMFHLFSSYYYYHHHHYYYYFADRQLNVVIPAVLGGILVFFIQ